MDLPVSSHFFLKLQWENGFSSQIASLHTCLIPLELKISLTDSFCLCGPSKVHCNLYLPVSWLSLRRGPTHSWCHPLHPHSTSYIQCSYFTSTSYFSSTWTFIFITYNHLWYLLWISLHTTKSKWWLPPKTALLCSNKMVTNAPSYTTVNSAPKSSTTSSLGVLVTSPTRKLLLTNRWSKS